MSAETTGLLGVLVLFLLLALRMHIGLAMALVGFGGYALVMGLDPALSVMGMTPYSAGSNYMLSVIPLFVLMGQFAFVSGLSRDIYRTVYTWLGHLPGGLAIATVVGCAGFSSICGSSLATAATMGTVAMPEMAKFGYDKALSSGCVAAGGTLGILIPPSIGFVIYGLLVEESIGKLFMAGIVPGVLLAMMFIATILVQCARRPALGPRGPVYSFPQRLRSLGGVWGILALFVLVIGGIYLGVFTPTEAAGVGAFGSFIIALLKRTLDRDTVVQCLMATGKTTAMIFLIIIGAELLSRFLAVCQLPMHLADLLSGLSLSPYLILLAMLLLYLALGCVMDCFAIMILTTPILFPVIKSLGFDPIWYGVMMVVVLEMGLITPPVGMNVFVIGGVAPDIPMATIFRGIWPFLIACCLTLVLLTIFPQLATFIPSHMSAK